MKALIGLLIPLLLTSPVIAEDMNATNLKGYQFSLLDIEKNCVAQRDGVANTLVLNARGLISTLFAAAVKATLTVA
jgi:hypothetical protein